MTHRGLTLAVVVTSTILLRAVTIETNATGEGKRTEAVAFVLLEFVHVATAQQRAVLCQIIEDPDTTPAQRFLARALLRALHTADPRDRRELQNLANDHSQSLLVQTLAGVIHDLEHTPTDDQTRAVMRLLRD